eukprot:760018-Hanusia_phi.AAC.2
MFCFLLELQDLLGPSEDGAEGGRRCQEVACGGEEEWRVNKEKGRGRSRERKGREEEEEEEVEYHQEDVGEGRMSYLSCCSNNFTPPLRATTGGRISARGRKTSHFILIMWKNAKRNRIEGARTRTRQQGRQRAAR